MDDLSEKLGLTAMLCLLILLIVVSSFTFEDNVNLNNSSDENLSNNSNNFSINNSLGLLLNESPLNDTFYDSINYGVLINDINTNKTILDINSKDKYSSSLTTNLLLNLAILDKYDENNKFNISVYKQGEVINGSLYGDLILVLEGNNLKSFSSNNWFEFKNLSKQIKDYGINQINGHILFDTSKFNNMHNISVTISPTSNRELANVTVFSNITYNIISNVSTVNYTTNDSINVIPMNNSTIVLSGLIFNESKPITLNISINDSVDMDNLFRTYLKKENITINEVDINYIDLYKETLLKNNLITNNLSDFFVNDTKLEVKNSTLFINVSFNNNSSLKYDNLSKIAFSESKSLTDYINLNLINNESISDYLYLLDNNSNKTFDMKLATLNEFLNKNNISNNIITGDDYHNNLLTLGLSNNLLMYLYNQNYFDVFYNNLSSINRNNTKIINQTVFYENGNDILLNESICGYMDIKGSKAVFTIYLNNITVSEGNESEKIMNDINILLEKVNEKYV